MSYVRFYIYTHFVSLPRPDILKSQRAVLQARAVALSGITIIIMVVAMLDPSVYNCFPLVSSGFSLLSNVSLK